LPHAKCILARFNAIRIRAKSYSEGPRAGWAAVLDLPVQNDFTCVPPDVCMRIYMKSSTCSNVGQHARTTSFEIQGIIRLRPADPAQCPLRGLDVYLGDGHYITLANLFSGRTGRILLREFLGIDPQSSLLERLVEASTPVRFRRSPSTLKPDFYIDTLEPQRSSQSQSEACVLRHRFVDLSLKLTPAQLAFTLGGKDVLPEKSRRRSLSRGLRALAIM
jgi:hypothetical protein